MKRVLIVNNNMEFFEALSEGLVLQSYQVFSCNKTETMVQKLQRCTPDLVIFDSDIDEVTMSTLLNDLATYDSNIPAIVLWKSENSSIKPNFEKTPILTAFVENDGNIEKLIYNVQKILPHFRFTDTFLRGEYDAAIGHILGNSVLKKVLGNGGTGIVFLAEHQITKKPVAIKVLSPNVYNEPSSIRRFLREASTLATIDHPNIVKILDADVQDGIYYLVMEYIKGTSLLELLNQKGKLPYPEAVQIISQVGQGLWEAHKKMILHRDLKPSNILISAKDHKVKIIDFGLARQVPKKEEIKEDITKEGIILGTPGYMPPEQALSKQLTESADIYSLGVTLYRCVTGKDPFPGNDLSTLLAQIKGNFPYASQVEPTVPEELSKIISKMMAKEKRNRYNSMEFVLQDLSKFSSTNKK